jgi:ATP-dependent RNA helicase RhlE
MQFTELGLQADILRAVSEQGYTTPTPIQQKAIPAVMTGRDLMASAQTGTGKTAGFTLPILHRLASGSHSHLARVTKKPRVLVLVPTRELAIQVEESVRTYGKHLPIASLAVFGGVGINPQIANLRRGVDIVVATPGRLLDHIQHARSTFPPSKFSFSMKPTACSTWASFATFARSSPCCPSSART